MSATATWSRMHKQTACWPRQSPSQLAEVSCIKPSAGRYVIMAMLIILAAVDPITTEGHNGRLHRHHRNVSDPLPVNIPSLLRVLRRLGDDHCLSTSQLADALTLSAYSTANTGREQKGVILTVCDLRCLENFFELFMQGIIKSQTGDFSQHVVVAALGIPAYVYCNDLRRLYKHRCVLDRFCLTKNHTIAHFTSRAYSFATLYKVLWVQELIRLGYSVFLVDADVYLKRNPLPWLFEKFADADMAVSSEYCEPWTSFDGDFVKWKPGDVFEQNSGQYLMNPTPNAVKLLQVWIQATLNLLLHERVWTMDQAVLNELFSRKGEMYAPVIKYTNGTATVQHNVSVNKHELNVYRVAFRRFNNMCKGICGCDGRTWGFRPLRVHQSTPHNVIECDIAQSDYDDLFGFHLNCCLNATVKRQALQFLVNGGVVPRGVGLPATARNLADSPWVHFNITDERCDCQLCPEYGLL